MVYWEGEAILRLWYAKELWLQEQLDVGIVKNEAQFSIIESIAAQEQEEKRKMENVMSGMRRMSVGTGEFGEGGKGAVEVDIDTSGVGEYERLRAT